MSPTYLTLGLALGHILTNGNVNGYGADHLQAKVLTALRGLDWAPVPHQENSMSQLELFLRH